MRYELDRETVQASVRAAALVFVVAWLFSDDLRAWIPVWLPIAVLLAAEVEFVLRGRRERAGRAARRVTPGPEDADLGFGELVEDEDGIRFVPPPARPVRARRRVAWFVGGVLAAAVVALAVRSDRAATWQALSSETRARAEARFTSEAAAIAGAAARSAATTATRSPAPGATPSASPFRTRASRTSTPRSAARCTTSRSAGEGATSGRSMR